MSPMHAAITVALKAGPLPCYKIARALPTYSPTGIRGAISVMVKLGLLVVAGSAMRDDGSYLRVDCYAVPLGATIEAPCWLYPHVATFAPDLILGVRDHRPSWN